MTFIFDTVARLLAAPAESRSCDRHPRDAPPRRRGHARAAVAGLLEAGARLGATVVWLEVDDDSGPARALYRSLGLRQHHRCRYLMLPAGGDGSVR